MGANSNLMERIKPTTTRYIDSTGTRREMATAEYNQLSKRGALGDHTVVGRYENRTGENTWENHGSVLWSLAKDATPPQSQSEASKTVEQRRQEQYQTLRPTGTGDMTKQSVKRKSLLGE